MKQRILLATTVTWPSAARLAGAFAAAGACVRAVFPRGHALEVSRYLDKGWHYRPLHPAASFVEAVRAAAPDVLVPCDDRALGLLLGLTEFAPLLERSLGPLAGYAQLTARAPSIAAARTEGILAPLTLDVPDLAALPERLQQTGLPAVLKSDASWGGDGVIFVGSDEDAARAFRRLKGPRSRLRSLVRAAKRRDLHFLADAREPAVSCVSIQSLVPGTPATAVFAAREGEVKAFLAMDVVRWSGATGPASLMQRIDDPAMAEAAEKLAARFRLTGLHGLDFVRDKAGAPHLIEINPRATQICHLALGADLPAALLGAAPRPAVTECRRIALFPQLLEGPEPPPAVFADIPWDDPAVIRKVAGDRLPEADALKAVPALLKR